jgi:outer membrane lipoprotein-sorting protein
MKISILLALVLLASISDACAQEKSKIKFGKITADDFKQTLYNLDSSADAMVVADIGSTQIVGNSKGSFSLEFKEFRRAHILNKNGNNIANIEILIYTDGSAEEELVT